MTVTRTGRPSSVRHPNRREAAQVRPQAVHQVEGLTAMVPQQRLRGRVHLRELRDESAAFPAERAHADRADRERVARHRVEHGIDAKIVAAAERKHEIPQHRDAGIVVAGAEAGQDHRDTHAGLAVIGLRSSSPR